MNFKTLILSFFLALPFGSNAQDIAKYAVTWDRQSTSSFDNMPLSGSKGAGANVWMQDGSLWIYLAHNGAYDEQEKLLKLGAIKIRPLNVALENIRSFQQTLDLQQSCINISFVSADGIKISLQVRYAGENLTVRAQTGKALGFEVAYGNWRSGANEKFSIINNGLS